MQLPIPNIHLALDDMSAEEALKITRTVGHLCASVKIHALFDEQGGSIVQCLKDAGAKRVWIDPKLHDIPKTVADRARAFVGHGANMLTVHASGDIPMMKAVVDAVTTQPLNHQGGRHD